MADTLKFDRLNIGKANDLAAVVNSDQDLAAVGVGKSDDFLVQIVYKLSFEFQCFRFFHMPLRTFIESTHVVI